MLIDVREKEQPAFIYALKEDVDVDNMEVFEKAMELVAKGARTEAAEVLGDVKGSLADFHKRTRHSTSSSS